MARRKPKRNKRGPSGPGVKLSSLMPGEWSERGQRGEGESRVERRVRELKDRATQEGLDWTDELEAKLRDCDTAGAVKRAWKEYRQETA